MHPPALVAAMVATLLSHLAAHAARPLTVAAESNAMIWNGVAVDRGRIYVSGPRWTGSKGPSVARIDAGGTLSPYPNAAWNGWRPGADPATSLST